MKISELKGVKQHISPDAARSDVDYQLRKAGFEPLGSGASATVWHVPGKPYVLKLFDSHDTPYLSFVDLAKHSNFNPYFPMFRGSPVRITPQVHAIRMERLKPMQLNWASALQRGFRVIMEALPLGSDWQAEISSESSEFSAQEKRDVRLALRKWPRLSEAADLLSHMYSAHESAHWDLHHENVMMRGSTPVFTDPFAV